MRERVDRLITASKRSRTAGLYGALAAFGLGLWLWVSGNDAAWEDELDHVDWRNCSIVAEYEGKVCHEYVSSAGRMRILGGDLLMTLGVILILVVIVWTINKHGRISKMLNRSRALSRGPRRSKEASLQELEDLFQRGVISDDEYRAARGEILGQP